MVCTIIVTGCAPGEIATWPRPGYFAYWRKNEFSCHCGRFAASAIASARRSTIVLYFAAAARGLAQGE